MEHQRITIDGNEAAAYVAYKTNEVIAIYPITPSSAMGEFSDEWSASGKTNLWGSVPMVVEMQSEGGAAGAVHGALQTGSLTTTFTASQGLLLMIPNMFKIAGELTSTVFHIAARSLATQGLSIFGDHGDVMAARSTGWAMLFANSVQEVMDFALIAQASTLEARVPFLHIFDGFRTSHEVMKIEKLDDADIRVLIRDDLVQAHRARGLTPEHPVMRGTAQNPDVYFQARETVNAYYNAVPEIVQETMNRFAEQVGRQYHLFDYVGAPDADRVIVIMGSGAETVEETVKALNARGERVGVVKVRLFRPFSPKHLHMALPDTVMRIAVLDRSKEPGGVGEPLYLDVVSALAELSTSGEMMMPMPQVIGGRYGLSSKEFTPAMVKAVFDEMLQLRPKNHFTVGILDDVTGSSLEFDANFIIEDQDAVQAVFWGLGADGTVSANKNSIKIIGEDTANHAQGYFVYDSKKSGARTISHLRFGPQPIHSPYLIQRANFIAVHQFGFIERYNLYNLLDNAADGATLLINAPYQPDQVWDYLPLEVQKEIIDRQLKLYVIDAYAVADETGMGKRINTIMQTCFFAISGVLPRDEAINRIKGAIRKTYGKRGEAVIQENFAAVDAALAHLHEVTVPDRISSSATLEFIVSEHAPAFVKSVTASMMAGKGDYLPVSALPVDGTYPTGTSQWEKRGIALEVPVWDTELCIQCGKCVMVCPHAAIRAKVLGQGALAEAPEAFLTADARWKDLPDQQYTLQVSVDDCTGCTLCVEVCPVKDKMVEGRKALNMEPAAAVREIGRINWDYFLTLPDYPHTNGLKFSNVKNIQLLRPLFEFSGACAGCGETPYLKLLSQLFGERTLIANATGCSSIYGGNLPTTPWAVNAKGRGPAWSNSLFEDNAEFGLGMRLTLDKQISYAGELVRRLSDHIGSDMVEMLLNADQSDETGIEVQRQRVADLKVSLSTLDIPAARDLYSLADVLVKRGVWIVGGDGWAYDIGYGGLDHVLASGRNVNLLVLDTEVYSNTGGQASKATPLGAVAKFAAGGKPTAKKDLGMMAMTYGNIYVAQIAMGANDAQTVRAFLEAEAYPGPSLIIAYGHCIAHGIDMAKGLDQQKRAVESGYWTLYRYNPLLTAEGKNPLQLDSKAPSLPLEEYLYQEDRYKMLASRDPEAAERFLKMAQEQVLAHWHKYEQLAK